MEKSKVVNAPDSFDAVTDVCAQFVTRSMAQGWKGKTRDKMALEFIGAMALATSIKDKTLVTMLGMLATLVSVRGFSIVEQRSKGERS